METSCDLLLSYRNVIFPDIRLLVEMEPGGDLAGLAVRHFDRPNIRDKIFMEAGLAVKILISPG